MIRRAQKLKTLLQFLPTISAYRYCPQVAELFMEYKANKERSVDVSIRSAFPLDAAAEEKLVSVLKRKVTT